MATTTNTRQPGASPLDAAAIERFHEEGFLHVPAVLSPAEVEEYRDAILALSQRMTSFNADGVFTQLVNGWRENETLRRLTFHPALAALAGQLARAPLRLWHDQVLIKQPHNLRPTEFHQDQPLWPHQTDRISLGAWVALVDVPVERGCMTFIQGSQALRQLAPERAGEGESWFEAAPELRWMRRVTMPIRAGDITFHTSRTMHTANDNRTDEPRVAHVVFYMDAETRYRAQGHPVTDPLGLNDGDPLDNDELFPVMPAAL